MFNKPTVNSVMSAFKKTITQLDEVADRNEVEAINLADQRNRLNNQIDDVMVEAMKARKIRDKLLAIVED